MATITAPCNLCTAQTGNGDSTNIGFDPKTTYADTGRPATVTILSTVGATPTVTVNIQGSPDGVNGWANIPWAVPHTGQYTTAPIVITTATTQYYRLRPGLAWRYVKLVLSLNTNVTLTADLT